MKLDSRSYKSQIDKTGGNLSPHNAVGSGNCLFSSSSSSPLRLRLAFSTWWLNTVIGDETGLAFPIDLDQPLHFPPSPWNVVLHHRGLRPLLFTNSTECGFFYASLRPTRIWTVKELWDGAYGFSSLSEKTKMSNCQTICCRFHNNWKAAHSPQLFQDPKCWSGRGLNRQFGHLSQPKLKKKLYKAQLKQFLLS